uniref:Uncharacterized protein n=1 Tax=Rhizophora mucronata TaxID=61149 RepID=A0A2P2NJQ1_RHIMU
MYHLSTERPIFNMNAKSIEPSNNLRQASNSIIVYKHTHVT